VQYLQRYLAVLGMYCVRNLPVPGRFTTSGELACKWLDTTHAIGRVASRNNQSDLTTSPFCKIGFQPIVLIAVFEPRMHRAHQHPVPERREPKVEWRKQMRVIYLCHC
jgi:hypothetical protein